MKKREQGEGGKHNLEFNYTCTYPTAHISDELFLCQVSIYTDCVEKLVDGALKGYNATVLAYGYVEFTLCRFSYTEISLKLFNCSLSIAAAAHSMPTINDTIKSPGQLDVTQQKQQPNGLGKDLHNGNGLRQGECRVSRGNNPASGASHIQWNSSTARESLR